jgi:DNA-binding MarR family transcriptional regulator
MSVESKTRVRKVHKGDRIDDLIVDLRAEFPAAALESFEIFGRLARLSRLATTHYDEILERSGLTSVGAGVLLMLRRAGRPFRLTPGELGEALMRPSSTIANTLERLERDGLIVRTPDRADRRSVQVELTSKGTPVSERILADLIQEQEPLLDSLSIRERNQVTDALRVLLCLFEQWTEALPSVGWRARRRGSGEPTSADN